MLNSESREDAKVLRLRSAARRAAAAYRMERRQEAQRIIATAMAEAALREARRSLIMVLQAKPPQDQGAKPRKKPYTNARPVLWQGQYFPTRGAFVTHLATKPNVNKGSLSAVLYQHDWDIDVVIAELSAVPLPAAPEPEPPAPEISTPEPPAPEPELEPEPAAAPEPIAAIAKPIYDELLATAMLAKVQPPSLMPGHATSSQRHLQWLTIALANITKEEFEQMSEPAQKWFDTAADVMNEESDKQEVPTPQGFDPPPPPAKLALCQVWVPETVRADLILLAKLLAAQPQLTVALRDPDSGKFITFTK